MALIPAIVLVFVLYRPAKQPELTTASTDSTHVLSFEEIRRLYEGRHDLESLLKYGRTLDMTLVSVDSIRNVLQERFFCELAKEAGTRYNIRWNVLYGLWVRESELNPLAKGDGKRNVSGRIIPGTFKAFGLGQVHLKTAQLHYDPNMTIERLMDPIENGMASAKILRDYTDLFNGNIRYGVSAYNQGPGKTMLQYKQRIQPKNIGYVMDVLQHAAEVDMD